MAVFARHDRELSFPWRLGVWVGGSALLGSVYALTGEEGWQVLAMFALVFGATPALARRVGERQPTEEREPPFRVFVASVVMVAPWAALCWVLVPESLGPWLPFWLVLGPWLEAVRYLTERWRSLANGEPRPKPRPLRDTIVSGLAVTPFIFALAIADDASLGESIATALLCGVIVFVIGGGFVLGHRRAIERDGL